MENCIFCFVLPLVGELSKNNDSTINKNPQ